MISGVEEVVAPAVEPSLVAFPNPASGDVRVRIEGLPAADVMREVTWRDAMGRIVHSDQIRLQPGDLITQSVALWSPGMYAVTLEGVGTARVLVK